jgi:glycerol transport system substrate-binding protein
VNSGAFTPQEAMDRLAQEMDTTMARMQRADKANNTYGGCGPRLNEEKDPSEWLGKGGAKAKLDNEKPQGDHQLRRTGEALAAVRRATPSLDGRAEP